MRYSLVAHVFVDVRDVAKDETYISAIKYGLLHLN